MLEQFFLKFYGNFKDSKDSKEKQNLWSSFAKDSKEKSSFGAVLEQFFRVDYLVLPLPLTPNPYIP